MKIIFLDIDGVLNSMDNLNSLLKRQQTLKDNYGELFDARCCNWLDYIIQNTNAQIVISSSWKETGLTLLKKMWADRNLPGEIIDTTKNLKSSRGHEIDKWIEENNPDSYVIIDDTPDFFEHHQERLILTNSQFGLTEDLAEKTIQLLT